MRPALGLLVLPIAACLLSGVPQSRQSSTSLNTAVLTLHEGQVIDGVPCLIEDLPVHHIHVHLEILLNGEPITVPAGIGIGRPWGVDSSRFIATGSCFAWIHTHDTTGVVHIVTPEEKAFTLDQLFEVWGQTLTPDSALGYTGRVAVLVNGVRFSGDPRLVPLVNLDNIVIELGAPPSSPAPALFDFGLLSL
jgi:hypothetical protein